MKFYLLQVQQMQDDNQWRWVSVGDDFTSEALAEIYTLRHNINRFRILECRAVQAMT